LIPSSAMDSVLLSSFWVLLCVHNIFWCTIMYLDFRGIQTTSFQLSTIFDVEVGTISSMWQLSKVMIDFYFQDNVMHDTTLKYSKLFYLCRW
jgi:hypothetical protein